jgi:type I restriction enzyme S subunit
MMPDKVKLADIARMRTGKLDSNAAVEDGEYPFFTCSQQTLRIDQPAYDTEAVLLGGNNAAGVFPLKYYHGQFNAYQRTYILETLDPNVLNTRYLYYALRPALSHFQSASIGAATQYLTKGILDNFRVTLPSIGAQNHIVDTLSAYDDLIENNRRRIQLLEQAARLLYKEWFVRLRFPGHEHTQIIDGVPEGWEKKVLGDLCYEVRETVSPSAFEASTPYIGLEHMPRCSITLCEWGQAEQVTSSKHRYREGEILFGKIRPYFHKVGIALTDGVASSDAIIIRPVHSNLLPLVLMTTSSDGFVAVTAQQMKEGSKMPRADWKQMQQYPVPLPPDGLLSSFNDYIAPILLRPSLISEHIAGLDEGLEEEPAYQFGSLL